MPNAMNPNLTLKARCWKCKESFHLVVEPADYDQKSRLVLKVVPCPYCEAQCQLKLREDQVSGIEVTRGPGGAPDAPQTWAQLSELERSRTVFETRPPDGPASPTKEE